MSDINITGIAITSNCEMLQYCCWSPTDVNNDQECVKTRPRRQAVSRHCALLATSASLSDLSVRQIDTSVMPQQSYNSPSLMGKIRGFGHYVALVRQLVNEGCIAQGGVMLCLISSFYSDRRHRFQPWRRRYSAAARPPKPRQLESTPTQL